jgi:hypothetical protein
MILTVKWLKMKRLFKVLRVALVLCLFSTGLSAQDSFAKTTNELSFDRSSEERFIEVYVAENTLSVHFTVSCELTEGSMSLLISNSDTGKEYGSFSVGGSRTSSQQKSDSFKERVRSDINKVINGPQQGVYVIKIKAEDAIANLMVTVEQYTN